VKCADGAADPRRQAKEAPPVDGRARRGEVAMQPAEVVVMVVMRHVDRLSTPTLRLDEDRTDRPQAEWARMRVLTPGRSAAAGSAVKR
jgi:hypothetical protein